MNGVVPTAEAPAAAAERGFDDNGFADRELTQTTK
jgi:hypothetical protein